MNEHTMAPSDPDATPDGDRADDPASEDPTTPPEATAVGSEAMLRTYGGFPPPRPPKRTGLFLDPDDLREYVGALLRVMLGGYHVDAYGNFTFVHDGAQVYVTVGGSPIGPQVGVFSVTNLDVDLTLPLASFLATTNHTLGFGCLSYDPENRAVWLRHTLLGTTLDGPELQTAVAAIASTAARIDDRIAERFGGRRFDDASPDVREHTRPPDTPQQAYGDDPSEGSRGYL